MPLTRRRLNRHREATSSDEILGGSHGVEAVAQEAGGLPLDFGTASRSAAPEATVFPSV
jgi:hypothetical protein